jgi:hypothetical protein
MASEPRRWRGQGREVARRLLRRGLGVLGRRLEVAESAAIAEVRSRVSKHKLSTEITSVPVELKNLIMTSLIVVPGLLPVSDGRGARSREGRRQSAPSSGQSSHSLLAQADTAPQRAPSPRAELSLRADPQSC